MPQIIMLNHASWYNAKRLESKTKRESSSSSKKAEEDEPVVWNGKRLSEMNSDELSQYYGDWGTVT